MVKVSKGAGPWLAKQKPNWHLAKPAWLVNLHSGIDWPVTCQSYLTQGAVPLRHPLPKQLWCLRAMSTKKLDIWLCDFFY